MRLRMGLDRRTGRSVTVPRLKPLLRNPLPTASGRTVEKPRSENVPQQNHPSAIS